MKIAKRRFTAPKGKTWEISLDGATCIFEGKRKKHASEEKALEDYVARVSAKLWERYVEVIAPGRPSAPMPEIAPADIGAQRSKLKELLGEANLAHITTKLEPAIKPAIALRLRRMHENDFELGASRFGGHPDLPARTEWPTYVEKATKKEPARARPLDFVAQLRMEDLASLDESKQLPESGLISFFVLGDYDETSSREPDYLSVCKVIFTPAKQKLERKVLPPSYGRPWNGKRVAEPYLAHAVEAFPVLTIQSTGKYIFKKLRLAPDEVGRFYEATSAFDQWTRTRFPGIRGTRLLGYRNRDEAREAKKLLLLQCETDYSAQMVWGDADFLYFWIAPKELARAKFDGVTSNYAD